MLSVPPQYHSELKGRLDALREGVLLWHPQLPLRVFRRRECRFARLRRHIVATQRWDRAPSPKILLRFDNPQTGGGTDDDGIFARLDTVEREIGNLAGARDGFIELINRDGAVAELLAAGAEDYAWIPDRDDSRTVVTAAKAQRRLRDFAGS